MTFLLSEMGQPEPSRASTAEARATRSAGSRPRSCAAGLPRASRLCGGKGTPDPGLSPDDHEAAPARSGLVERGLEEAELLLAPHDNRTQDLPHAVSIVGSFPRGHWSVRAGNRSQPRGPN
jgi:hypothetical protein